MNKTFFSLLAVILMVVGPRSITGVQAQGLSTVNVVGVPPILESPFTDRIEMKMRSGQYQVIFNYSNSNTAEVEFRFEVTLYKEGEEQISVISDPRGFRPGAYVFISLFDELHFPQTFSEVMNQVDSDIRKQVIQEGTLPEGTYQLHIRAIPEDNTGAISSTVSITPFVVRYPQAPMLISPSDESNMPIQNPVFAWTPVVDLTGFPIQYEFLLVEVLENQTPLQAINSNRAHAELLLAEQTTLTYTPDFLPLEDGRRYAWQVTASYPGLQIPIKNDGESPIYTFTYSNVVTGSEQVPQEIVLEPGFAKLVQLNKVDSDKNGNIQTLNGPAVLELTFENQSRTMPVNIKDLNLIHTGQDNPILISGMVETEQVGNLTAALEEATELVEIDELRWIFGPGFQVSGKIKLPDGSRIPTVEFIPLTPAGLNGTLAAEDPDGFFDVGTDPLELILDRVEAIFPSRRLIASGGIELFNNAIDCAVDNFNLLEDGAVPVFACPENPTIPLVGNLDHLKLELNNFGGTLDYDFEAEDLRFDLGSSGQLIPGFNNQGSCAVNFTMELTSAEGLSISRLSPGCSPYAPPLDLGFVKFQMRDLNLQTLTYNGNGAWDYDLSIDGLMEIPAMDNWQLPEVTVDLAPNGLRFPEADWSRQQLGVQSALEIGQFSLEPLAFSMDVFTFPWFDWNRDDIENDETGDWKFTMDLQLNLPGGGQNGILPPCVSNQGITIEEVAFDNGSLSTVLPATVLQDCSVNLAEGYIFHFNKLGGSLSADASASDLNLDADLLLDAGLEAGFPFACKQEEPITILDTDLALNEEGLLEGSVEDIVDTCPAEIGPFQAEITESALVFSTDNQTQQAVISTSADLIINDDQSFSGSFSYDIINGRFENLQFEADKPFIWNLPSKEQPVLSFLIDQFTIDENGILIDGRQKFVIGDQQEMLNAIRSGTGDDIKVPEGIESIDVTFDQVLLSLQDLSITSGRILFDESFGLKAGIDAQTQELAYSVMASPEDLDMEENSLYAMLGSTIVIDSNGLQTGGASQAGIRYDELHFEDLSVEFSDNFAMGLNPFKVKEGQADMKYQNRRLALIDHSGLTLDPSFLTQALPDTLGLPVKETAYLVLRDQDDNLKVEADQQSDGSYLLSTDSPIELSVPVLQGSRPSPPTTQVTFTNIEYDPGRREVTSGMIEAVFDPAVDLTDMGIPIRMEKLRYDDGFAAGAQRRGVFLDGEIKLYEQEFGDNGKATLFLQDGNRIRSEVDLKNIDAAIPLLTQSSLAILNVDSLNGTLDIPLEDPFRTDILFDMSGQFRLHNQGGNLMAALNYRAAYDDGDFTITGINQPARGEDAEPFSGGPLSFRIDKINTLSVSYRSTMGDFDFRSELDFSLLMKLQDGDTVTVPLKMVEITENGFLIPDQTLNETSTPALNVPSFNLGPAEMTLLEFRTLRDISFNWFTGEEIPPAFEMDLEMKLASLKKIGPRASQATISLNNVGFNQGVVTGQIYPYPFDEGVAPVSLGTDAEFLLEQVEGGLTNTGSDENPVQGYDIQLTGHLDYPRIFINAPSNCEEPLFTVNLSEEGGMVGSVNNITPCGQLVYGPATLLFDPDTRLEFSFTNDTQRVFLDGGVTANLQSLNNTTVTATGQVSVDITTGQFSSGSILVDDLFIYQYPQADPLFTFRVQQARLDQNGVVISGDAGLTYPDSPDTARVRFTNFTIHPQEEEIRSGSFTVRDSLGFEVDISPIEWRLVDPSTAFTRDNTARLLVASGATINKEGLWLNGSSEASIRGGGQTWIDLKLDYSSFQVQFAPVRVTSGQAEFTLSDENTPFGHLDRQGFELNLPGLITSVIPDTLDIPRRNTAFLVLGDQEGNRYELVEDQGVRTLRTLPGETVDLLIPGFTSTGNDTLTAQVKFDLTVDQFFNVNDGSISLQNEVDLQPYVQLPVKITELAYDGNSRQLSAGATFKLPASLSDVDMTSEMVIDQSGFKEGSIAAGEYRTTYLPNQENVTPIAADTLGDETLEFYVRGLEIQFGQNRSIGFSGQLKSSLLKDAEGNKSPLHFAAEHTGNDWDFQVDASHLPQNGIDLGYAKVEPIPDPQGSYLGLFDITMDQDEFAVSFAGIISLPDLTGDGFEVTVDQLKIGSAAPYVSIDSQADLPDQNFTLFGDIMTFSTRDISVSFDNRVLAVELDGTFDFYTEQDIAFRGLVFKSDGTVDMQGGLGANLLPEELEMLSDSTLVLKELSLELSNDKLGLAALASAQLPDPLSATSDVRISVDTEGNTDISGPAFVFDEGFSIDGDPTEYKIGSFATLELTGLGLSLNLSDPQYTSLYAAGVIFVENDVNKRIIFGNAGDLERNPGIKYTPNQGVEWNVQSNFDPDSSPLSFDYEFFSVDIESIHIENDVLVDNETVPFQAEIGGKTGLAVKGVEGKVGFSGFKFSTRGVDEIGRIDGGGSFTLMNIFSLELGEFDFNAAPEGETVTLKFVEGQSGGGNPSVDSTEVEVRKYLHFRQGMGGQALGISLTDGISGGIEEVLYYEREDGELFLRIRDASIELHDQAQLSVGMLYKTAGDGGSGASLTVAGGGSISSVGIAAAGKISTLNSQLSFGVFVAAKATVNILGIAEASSLGGGFFYRPDMQDLNMVIDGVEAMDSQFDLNGPQPDVENLKLAILLYAGISVAGVGDQAAISGSGLIQITDQFFKIDVDGVVLNQEGRLEAGSYLTVRYTPELVGAEGNVEIHVDYGEPLNGTATIDFFASKDRTSPGSDILWGITGNMDLTVIEILELNGDFIASPDGMLVDAQLIRGPSTPIISAQSSFKLTAWYIPGYTDPFGIYSQFKAELNIVKGLASIGVGVSGGYFDRGSYHQLYFTGSAYVNAVAFEGRVKGFVKLQNRSPNVKFGKGSNSSMEQMIADARDKADQSSAKADQTRDKIEQANNDLDNSIADHTEFKRTAQQLEKAGFRMLTADQFSYYDRRSMLESVENTAEPLYNSPFESLSYGQSPLDHIFKNILLNIRQPTTSAMPDLRSEASLSVQSTRQAAGPVLNRLEQGRNELQQIADRMDAQLGGDYSGIDNPVENIQTEITGPGGELVSAPGFQVNSETAESNSNRLNTLDNERRQADQRYRQAIEAAAANVQLVDLLLDGTVSIEWGSGTGVQLQPDQQNSVSVIGNKYYNAVRRVRSYNARLIAQYWKLHDWAQQQLEYLENNQSSIESYVEWKNSWSNFANLPGTSNPTLEKVADLAVAMDEAIAEFQGTTPTSNIHSVIMDNSTNSRNKFNELAMDFWYRMPLLGLRAVRDEARDRADELDIEFEDKLSAVNTSYADFTQTIDGLYGIKTDMLTTVYGMIEEYNAWRSSVTDTENQPAEAPFSDQLQSIENALAPPTIDYLEAGVVNAQNDYVPVVDYYSKVFLDFGASHPSGVSEISYNLMENTLSSTYFVQDFYTKGFFVQGASGIRFDFPKRAVNQRTQPLTGVIRARGEGGVTAKRLINIEIPVAPGSQKSSATIVTLGEDTSPPTTPDLDHVYLSYDGSYWTPDSSKLSFTIKSRDLESGIAKFQYKIGSTPGGDEVRKWTDAQGTRGVAPIVQSKMETTIRGLRLDQESKVYVTFRTVNGDGVNSSVNTLSKPIAYEPTPPVKPTVSISPDPSGITRQQAPQQPLLRRSVADYPAWNSNRVNTDGGSADGQEYVYSWSSNDPETAIKGYSVSKHVTGSLPPSQAFAPDDGDFVPAAQSTQLTLTPSFTEEEYLYIRARNHAGIHSTMQVIGPIRGLDVTPPTAPDATVEAAHDKFIVYITQLSDDSQTGIKGYQYAILNAAGTDTLRGWPDASSVDFAFSSSVQNNNLPPFETIRPDGFITSGRYQIAVRAVNGHEMVSRPVLVQEVFLDRSPPEKVLASAEYSGQKSIQVDFSEIGGDPESGLKNMRFEIVTESRFGRASLISGSIRNYTTTSPHYLKVGSPYFENHTQVNDSTTMEEYMQQIGIYLYITTQNNAGLETTNRLPVVIPKKFQKEYISELKAAWNLQQQLEPPTLR